MTHPTLILADRHSLGSGTLPLSMAASRAWGVVAEKGGHQVPLQPILGLVRPLAVSPAAGETTAEASPATSPLIPPNLSPARAGDQGMAKTSSSVLCSLFLLLARAQAAPLETPSHEGQGEGQCQVRWVSMCRLHSQHRAQTVRFEPAGCCLYISQP